jgi:hypothetical protein
MVAGSGFAQTRIAVFGDNGTDDFINTLPGFQAVLVTNANLEVANFLVANDFDAFYYTRTGSGFGDNLSVTAAANVATYVGATGNIVLLNGDFADSLPGDANIAQLTRNAVTFASASGRGYIGEFRGAGAALTTDGGIGATMIGLIPGTAGTLGGGNGGSSESMVIAPAGFSSAVLSGVTLPYNPPAVEFGQDLSGVAPSLVHATWGSTGNPAIIVRGAVGNASAPEPGTIALLLMGGFGFVARRKRKA